VTSIRSRQHRFIQRCRALARGYDSLTGEILLDGTHLVQEALGCGLENLSVAIDTDLLHRPDVAGLVDRLACAGANLFDASADAIAAASPVRTPSGIVAIATMRLGEIDPVLRATPAMVVAPIDVQDPGNLGAMIRTAEAAGATGVVRAGQSADPLSWKAIRGSMGSVFRLPVAAAPSLAGLLEAARALGLAVVAATPVDGRDVFDVDLTRPLLLLMGGEGGGLSPAVAAAADLRIRIPMAPPVESLNVAVATGIILFEAQRQRQAARRT